MPRPDPDTLTRMHRWFAIECNNDAWDLNDQDPLSDEDQRLLLATAYASAYHWHRIGQPINRVRADMLLARVHVRTNDSARALAYAKAAVKGLDDPDSTNWDRAFGHVVLAQAAVLHHRTDQARTACETALALTRKLEGEERSDLEAEVARTSRMLEETGSD